MKKYMIRGGVLCAAPLTIVLLLHFLTPGEENIFTFATTLLTALPEFILPSFLPRFGIVGIGDVFGFVYLSEVISAIVYYFIVGLFLGWIFFKLKMRKM